MYSSVKKFSVYALLILVTACASTKTDTQKAITLKSNVVERKTAEEVSQRKVKDDEFKNYMFQRTVKIRITNDASAKITKQIDEGTKLLAFIEPLGDGWFYFKNKTGDSGFYFGNAAILVGK
jgi:hypothetical protein